MTENVVNQTATMSVASAHEIASGIFQYKLVHANGASVGEIEPGSHIELMAPSGVLRQYSLCNQPGEDDGYVIAIKREAQGRGGSRSLVDGLTVGSTVEVGEPRNYFALSPNAKSSILIAGGIGITPILAMARQLAHEGKPFKLIYCAQGLKAAAYAEEVRALGALDNCTTLHFDEEQKCFFDFDALLETFMPGTHLYCCGPAAMMHHVRDMARHWPGSHLHFEDFGVHSAQGEAGETSFQVTLARQGATVEIPPGKTILEVLRSRGYPVSSSCESGTCGACRTKVLGGTPDHKDYILDEDEPAEMMICVSRSKTASLVLDI